MLKRSSSERKGEKVHVVKLGRIAPRSIGRAFFWWAGTIAAPVDVR
jgi:hypothetical protein